MANNTKEFTIKINGIDVAIKNTKDLEKAIGAIESNLNSNKYGEAEIKKFQKLLADTKTKGEELKKELSKKAGFNVTIDGAPQFISTINELEKAKEQLDEKLKNTDRGTDAFARMQAELQHVNTEIEKFDVSVEHITIDKKLATAGAVVSGVGGAFATATSGAALFGKQMGIDADTVQKYSDEANNLIAFLAGLQSVTSAFTGENLKNLKSIFNIVAAKKLESAATAEGTAATEGATAASKIFGVSAKTAIASTGIGLLVVALVLVYQHFDSISSAAKKFGDYVQPFIGGLIDKFSALGDAIRNAASALTGGFIDNATTAKKKDIASDSLDKLKEEEDYQKKAIDLQGKGEIERLKQTAAFEKNKLKLMVDSGEASVKEIKAQQQLLQAAEKASNDAMKAFREEQARSNIELTSKTEGEKLRRTKQLEIQKLAELRASVGTENELYQKQLIVVQTAGKAVVDDNKAKGIERQQQALDLKKKLIEISNATEQEKAALLFNLDIAELARIKKANGAKSKQYKDYYINTLSSFKTFVSGLAEEELKARTLRDSIENTNAKVASNANALPGEPVQQLTNTDKFNLQLQKDLEKNKLPTTLVPIEIVPQQVNKGTTKQAFDNAILDAYQQLKDGQIPDIDFISPFIDKLLGKGATSALFSSYDQIFNMIKDTNVKALDEQLATIDALEARTNEVIDAAQARLDAINGQLTASDDQLKTLEQAKNAAKGSERDAIIVKLEKERAKRNHLAADQRKEDDRIKKAQAEQLAAEKKRIELEKERQAEIDKTNKVVAIAKALNDAVTAGLAIQSAIKAISGANSVPFPGNIAAIAIALGATIAAISSAKAIKFADGGAVPVDGRGVAVGRSHGNGGIPFAVAGTSGYEMEGGEHITNRSATSKNIDALDTINRYGDRMKFKAVPIRGYYETGGTVGNFPVIQESIQQAKADNTVLQVMQMVQVELAKSYEASLALSERPQAIGVDQISLQQNRVAVIQSQGLSH